jgi:hypothetical protein
MSRLGTGALLALFLLSPRLAWGGCEPVHRAGLAIEVQAAYQAFRQLDRAGFEAHRDAVQAQLACMAEPIQPSDAASIHGLMALSAFLAKDDGGSVASLHAAVRSYADFDLPQDLFPAGHPLRLHLQVARSLQPGSLRPLPLPPKGAISVDGASADAAPGDRPCLLQWSVDQIEIQDTAYLAAGSPMPDWGPVPRRAGDRDRPWKLVGASGSAAVIAGGLAGLAAQRHARFTDDSTPYEQLPGLRRDANGLTIAAGGLGLAAVGFGAAAVLRW